MQTSGEKKQLYADEFLRGLLAALVLKNHKRIRADEPEIHRAFHRVMLELKKPDVLAKIDVVDLADVDYDPLYAQSRWFDRELTRAQRNLVLSFPNPTYATIAIKYEEDEAERILDSFSGARDTVIRLAEFFHQQLNEQPQQVA